MTELTYNLKIYDRKDIWPKYTWPKSMKKRTFGRTDILSKKHRIKKAGHKPITL